MFTVNSSQGIFHANKIEEIFNFRIPGSFPYIVRSTKNNGLRGYIVKNEKCLNEGQTLSFAQDTFTVFYQKEKYFTGNKIKILKPRFGINNESIMNFLVSCFKCTLNSLSWGIGSTISSISNMKIQLPTKQGKIDYNFMESFIAELEAERVAELEAYLKVSGFDDYELSDKEKHAIDNYNRLEYKEFDLKFLFGKSTRGKRLKSADRIPGDLPFVTAGETNEGISDFIGNKVEIFKRNTTTIDMFGSAKYRNYNYGCDDHIAVVHTEKLPMGAAIFVTTSIHKSSHNGQFHYGKNFYAKDADKLQITLPHRNGKPDYEFMETFILAIQKLVIKDVVLYKDKKIEATKKIVNK